MTYEPETDKTKLHYELSSIRENEMERSCRVRQEQIFMNVTPTKNEILKAKRKTPNRNYYIPISNIGLEENGYGMHRETKSKAIRKLAYAGLIKWEKEVGGTFRIIKLI